MSSEVLPFRARPYVPDLCFATIHGHRRAYRIGGTGPAVLLLHGIGDNSLVWDSVLAPLTDRFTVIAPDLLGHGLSDRPRADYSVAAFANGMRDLLCYLGIERVSVVGHSLGGGVAGQFAYQFPEMVERIAFVAPAASITTSRRCCACSPYPSPSSSSRSRRCRARSRSWRPRCSRRRPCPAPCAPTRCSCAGRSTACRTPRPRTPSRGRCDPWWTCAGRSSPCSIGAI